MKIEKLVTVGRIVEVDVSLEDIANAINETADSVPQIVVGINNCAQFLKAIPDAKIDEMNETQRRVISEFLVGQSRRFAKTIHRDENHS